VRGIALFFERMRRPAARGLHQLYGEHRVRQPSAHIERREQGGGGPNLIGEAAERLTRTVVRGHDPLQLVDSRSGERPESVERRCEQRRFECGGCVGNRSGDPVIAHEDGQPGNLIAQAVVVRYLPRFDEKREPRRARPYRVRPMGVDQRLCERAADEPGELLPALDSRQPNHEPQRVSVEPFASCLRCHDGAFDHSQVFAQRSNYNDAMLVVRYIVLAALVVWLGGALQAIGGDLDRHLHALAYACGGVMLVGLLVLKFVGPPPHGFLIRIALILAVLGVTTVAVFRGQSRPTTVASAALGGILLAWYARE
jgi:hypothetical protein